MSGQDTMLAKLEDQYRSRLSLIDTITEEASKRDAGLSDQDRQTITNARAEAEKLRSDIDLLAERIELSDVTAERLRKRNVGDNPLPGQIHTRGELLAVKFRAASGDRDALHRYETFMRAAQHMGTTAAATTPTAGGMPGLLVVPNVGPVIDVRPSGRPFAAALGVVQSTDPMAFRRPRISDPATGEQGMGPQGLEKAELPSRAFDVTAQDVTLETVGGYLNISQQLLAMPIGALDLTLNTLERRYARVTEARVLTAATTGADTTVTLAADGGGAAFLAAVYSASARVYAATGELASWIAMGPTGYARIGSFVDLADRPLFPSVGGVNAMGTAVASDFQAGNIAGLRPVVTPAITDGRFIIGNSLGVEAYEYRFPVFDTVEPSVLGRQVAVSGAFGTYRPVAGGVAVIAPAAA